MGEHRRGTWGRRPRPAGALLVAAFVLGMAGFAHQTLSVAGILAGSSAGEEPATATARGAQPPPTSTTVPPAEDSWDRMEAGVAMPGDFPDPAVLADGGRYVAFSTQSGALNIPVITSSDLESWSAPVDALPQRPGWSTSGPAWAPAALRRGDGRYLLAYAVRHDDSGKMCVSVAVADQATGPYVDTSTDPLICDDAGGGAIDPSFFVDPSGATWLLWKAEATGEVPGRILSQRLDPLSLTLFGEPAELVRPDRAWEQPTVENPALAVLGDSYVLVYSGNRWDTASYATGWAVCRGPMGPCEKADEPLLASDGERAGPGGASWFPTPDGRMRIAYHGWIDGVVGYPPGRRALYLAEPSWDGSTLAAST
jgi:Glycosyl hydrolases family 43